MRLIEDFLARTGLGRCKDFAEVGEVMSKVRWSRRVTLDARPLSLPPARQVAFRSLLAITPTLVQHPVSPTQPKPAFSLIFDENPLTDFVELPEEAVEGGLVYAKVLEGVIRGALEMVRSRIWSGLFTAGIGADAPHCDLRSKRPSRPRSWPTR